MFRDFSLLKALLLAYTVSTGFTDVLDLPLLGSKVQIPELVFIPLFLVWLSKKWRQLSFKKIQPNGLEYGMIIFMLITTLSAFISGTETSWLEVAGLFYLFLVYIVFKSSLKTMPEAYAFLLTSFIICGSVAAIFGISGWILTRFDIDTILAMPADIYYPYLGFIGRAIGLMVSSNMLFNLLGICFLLYLPTFLDIRQKKTIHFLIFFILAAGMLFTFSKSILILVICILFIIYRKYQLSASYKFFIKSLSVFLFIIFIAGTHILVRNDSIEWSQRKEKAYTEDDPFKQIGNYKLYYTNYAVNHKTALKAGIEYPILGLGPGMYNKYVGELKKESLYPSNFINFDPHSTYLGAFAEMGFFGLCALLLICVQIVLIIRKNKSLSQTILISMSACLLFMALEAISMDIMNFRHLWILLGALVGIGYNNKQTESSSQVTDAL